MDDTQVDTVEGIKLSLCTMCKQTFTAPSVFDMHLVYGRYYISRGRLIRPDVPNYDDPRCLTPEEMEAIGLRRNTLGRWTSGAMKPSVIRQLSGISRETRDL